MPVTSYRFLCFQRSEGGQEEAFVLRALYRNVIMRVGSQSTLAVPTTVLDTTRWCLQILLSSEGPLLIINLSIRTTYVASLAQGSVRTPHISILRAPGIRKFPLSSVLEHWTWTTPRDFRVRYCIHSFGTSGPVFRPPCVSAIELVTFSSSPGHDCQ